LDKNWQSFFASIKDWKKNPPKYLGKPDLPKYKHKATGRQVIHYEKGAISKKSAQEFRIKLSKTNIEIPTNVEYDDLVATRIIPNKNHFVIEVIYKKEPQDHDLNKENIIGIDIGINNLMSCATKKESFIVNGKPIKSINQFYNKRRAKLQSELAKDHHNSNKILSLTNKRNNKINDLLHKSSNYIINYCLTNDIGKLIIGKNDGWKHKVNLGKRNNQNFIGIPFNSLIHKLKYKCELHGIEFVETEESYTSKCSFVDDESLQKHDNYVGNRVKRGLFQTKLGMKINADINGALNIIRKVVPLFSSKDLNYGIEGVAVHPLLVKSFA
jgi:putative transposase